MAPAPVHVTVDAPRTPKLAAEPSVGEAANAGEGPKTSTANPMLANRIKYLHFILNLPFPKLRENHAVMHLRYAAALRCNRDASRSLPETCSNFGTGDDYTATTLDQER
jgi:hypothetical protein